MDDGNEIPRKRRIQVERRAKASISSDPSEELTEAISQHLDIARNRSFNELSTKEKEEVGISLKTMLSDVSDGALMPLMHYTLNAGHILKLVKIKQIQSSIAKDLFGVSEGGSFASMSEVEKGEIGSRLRDILKDVSGGALVPILNSSLTSEEVKKLASLREVRDHETDTASSVSDVKKEEPKDEPDDDELMAAADSDIQCWQLSQKLAEPTEMSKSRITVPIHIEEGGKDFLQPVIEGVAEAADPSSNMQESRVKEDEPSEEVMKAEACQISSQKSVNLRIADFLYELATYEQTVTQQKFKANAYRKAAAAIAKHDVEISSGDQAQKMDGVGKKIAEKIDEFLKTGEH